MFRRLIWKALWERRQRVALALAALTVASTLATALLGLYSGIERKLRGQFEGYGANVVISPAGERQTIPLSLLSEVEKYGAAAPWLYAVRTVNGEPIVVAGTDFDRIERLTRYWQISGQRRPSAGECLAGERVAERFHLRPGSSLEISGERRTVSGIVSTGAAEDSQVILPIEEIGRDVASLITARIPADQVPLARAALASAHPEVEVRILRAVVESEANVVLKIRGTLFLLTLVILLITGLCVMNNFGAIVYQRRKEIGILKAIGGGDRRIAAFFASEAAILGVLGSVAGFGVGGLVARWLGWQIFRQPIPPTIETLPLVVAITLVVTLAATIAPLREIWRIEPAVILRDE